MIQFCIKHLSVTVKLDECPSDYELLINEMELQIHGVIMIIFMAWFLNTYKQKSYFAFYKFIQ